MDLSMKIAELLKSAKDAGASASELAEIRHHFKTNTDWNPTKKRLTDVQRKTKRQTQRASRRGNRNNKNPCRKGQQVRANS